MHQFHSAQRQRVHEEVGKQLARTIVRGDFAPGAQVPAEALLATQFDVSRPVVREALRSLEQRGLIETSQGRRAVVRSPHEWDVFDPLVLSAHREEGMILPLIRDFLWIRSQLEPVAAAEAAENPSPALIADLRAILARMEASLDAPDRFFVEDLAFHTRIADAVSNRVVARLMRTISKLFNLVRDLSSDTPSATRGALKHHQFILDRFIARDPDGARTAMEQHLRWTQDRLLSLPSERAVDDRNPVAAR